MNDKEWLANLKVGDTVVVQNSNYGCSDSIRKVARLTKTQIVLESGSKFRRNDGTPVNADSWNRRFLYEATSEAIDKIKQERLASSFRHIKWNELPLEVLSKISDLIGSASKNET